MKAYLYGAAIAAAGICSVPASAATFTGDYTVNVSSIDPGLVIGVVKNVAALSIPLPTPNSSFTFNNLFTVWTGESAVNPDDLASKPISVTFDLDPVVIGSATGTTVGQSRLFGAIQNGLLSWDNGGTFEFAFGDGGLLGVTLTGGTFNGGIGGLWNNAARGVGVDVTFTLLRDANPTTGDPTILPGAPEPITWAMMTIGFGGIGYAMRRRRPARVAFQG